MTALPIAESSRVQAQPPWTWPIGLYCDSAGLPGKRATPSSAETMRKPSVAPIGGCAIVPSQIARKSSRPVLSMATSDDEGSASGRGRAVRNPYRAGTRGAVGLLHEELRPVLLDGA